LSNQLPEAGDWAPPLLRWAGSKRKLIHKIKEFIPFNSKRYVEPFAGSACLFFALKPGRAVLNDLNSELIETYVVVRDHPRLVSRAAHEFLAQDYYAVRAMKPGELAPVIRAARFVCLNRTCFNGVYRTNRSGEFNVPRGTRTGGMPSEAAFYRCAVALRSAKLRHGDFYACLEDVRKGDFVYLDPPYATDGRVGYGEYGYGCFSSGDIPRLVDMLDKIDRKGATFLLSYAAWPDLLKHVDRWHCCFHSIRHNVSASASRRNLVDEVLVTNRG
jgi:DNA adenine methylase